VKVSEAAKYYEDCMEHPEIADCENCPLYKILTIKIGEGFGSDGGSITWKIQGCSLVDVFEQWLKDKKPGTPIDSEKTEEKDATARSEAAGRGNRGPAKT
jgi:Zn-finger protein